ncbi:MAG: type III secretion inner membrane ring lipoprotein SctJ [Kiritimatiellae bacterium]|nr:type III secretion inner membrane ring lipoprotein SctJ [Kiritimatiellia bacterium]
MKRATIPVLAAMLLLVAGCNEQTTLFSSLEEGQANAIMAALLTEGISCTKTPGDEGTWNVMISSSRFAEAANLCEKRGLPRRPFAGIGEAFKKTGMVSSPSEERIRFMDAISQDLAKTISMIDGALDARVHVVLPQNDPFAKNTIPSSAAVAVRARWDADLADAIPQIKSLVKNSIEGLSFEKITVTIFQDSPPKK